MLQYGFLKKTLPVNVPGTWWAKFQSFWMSLRSTSSKDHKIWMAGGLFFSKAWLFSFSIFPFSPASVWRKTGENLLLETGLWAFPWIQPCRRDNKGLGFPRKSTQKSTPKNFWRFFRCSPLVVAANLKKGGFLLQAVLIHVTVHC